MTTIYYTACSLDGFLATEDHGLDWLFPLADIRDTSFPAFFETVGALAMGASTYEWMLRHVVRTPDDPGTTWPYAQPVWVFTHRRLPVIKGADVRFVQGDVLPVHAAMQDAAQGRTVWLVGGGELVGQFLDAGLVDEIRVQIGSVTLGRGQPLLPRRFTSPPLKLLSVAQVGSGFAELTYAVPRPDPAAGSQALRATQKVAPSAP